MNHMDRQIELQSETYVVDGHSIRVWKRSCKNPSATVVLIHGRTWSTRTVYDLETLEGDRSLMKNLSQNSIETFGIDLRGYGETPRDSSEVLTPQRAVNDVIEILEQIKTQQKSSKVYLFGWSFGALLAHYAVQKRPETVSGLILFGYPLKKKRSASREKTSNKKYRVQTTQEMAMADFLSSENIEKDVISSFVEQALMKDPDRMDWANLEQLSILDPKCITVPVLLLQGGHDQHLDKAKLETFFNLIRSDVKIQKLLPENSHVAFLEPNHEQFTEEIVDFLEVC